MKSFVPDTFTPPKEYECDDFVLKPLTYKDAETDYEAVMSSMDTIHKIRNGSWPTVELTLEENRIDLAWHQREFEFKQSFSYIIWDKNTHEYLGCVYLYRPQLPWVNIPSDSDADVNVWVTTEAYNKGLYPTIFNDIKDWVKSEWPFENPYYSNKEIPGSE